MFDVNSNCQYINHMTWFYDNMYVFLLLLIIVILGNDRYSSHNDDYRRYKEVCKTLFNYIVVF